MRPKHSISHCCSFECLLYGACTQFTLARLHGLEPYTCWCQTVHANLTDNVQGYLSLGRQLYTAEFKHILSCLALCCTWQCFRVYTFKKSLCSRRPCPVTILSAPMKPPIFWHLSKQTDRRRFDICSTPWFAESTLTYRCRRFYSIIVDSYPGVVTPPPAPSVAAPGRNSLEAFSSSSLVTFAPARAILVAPASSPTKAVLVALPLAAGRSILVALPLTSAPAACYKT